MNTPTSVGTNGNQGDKQALLKEIQAKWTKFSEPEVAALKNRDELISQVRSKYSLDAPQADREVDGLLNGRSF